MKGKVMAEVSTIVGITFMVIGSLLVSLGLFLCYTTKVCKTFFFTFFSLMDTFSIACNKSVQRLPANVVMQGSRRNVSKKGSVRGAPQQCAKKKEVNFLKAFSYFLTLQTQDEQMDEISVLRLHLRIHLCIVRSIASQ